MTQPIVYVAAQATRAFTARTSQSVRRMTQVSGATARTALAANGRGSAVEAIAVGVGQARTVAGTRVAASRGMLTGGTTSVARPTTGLLWPPGGWSRK